MLSALAGADALEILVVLRNMASSGLSKLESDVARTEGKVNSTNFSGFSKASKTMETDAEKAAGKAEGGGGGLGNMISSALGIPGPLLIAGAAVGGFAALSAATIPVYEKTQVELKATAAAAAAHGMSMAALTQITQTATAQAVNYGIGVDDVRQSVEKMTMAGIGETDQLAAMPAIMDLAVAKNMSMVDATNLVTTAMMGNAKGLKALGILLPSVSGGAADVTKATTTLTTAQQNLKLAQDELAAAEGKHVVTTTKSIAVTKGHTASAVELGAAERALSLAQMALTAAQDKGNSSAYTLASANDRVLNAEARLNALQGQHAVTTDKVSHSTKGAAASALTLEKAHAKVTTAEEKLKAAQDKLTLAQQGGVDKGTRLAQITKDITGATGDQSGTMSSLQKSQVELGDAWDTFSNTIAPGLVAALGFVIDKMAILVGWLSQALGFIGSLMAIKASDVTAAATRGSAAASPSRGMLPPGYGGRAGASGTATQTAGHHATGGWVGMNGPELSWVGEQGPEYISPNKSGGRGGGGTVVNININTTWPPTTEQAKQIAQTVAKHLARNLNVAPKTTRPYGSL